MSSGNNDGKDFAVHLLELHANLALEHGLNIGQRTIQLVGDIDADMFCKIDSSLSLLEAQSRKSVTIKINSEGGSVYDALAIVGRIQRSPCKITTEGYGCIMSAATIILASGHSRKMHELAWFMTHQCSYGVEGRHQEIKNIVAQTDREEEMWCSIMSRLTGKSLQFWQLMNSQGDKFFSAQEALDAGVVNELF